jgi:hypothetical protein
MWRLCENERFKIEMLHSSKCFSDDSEKNVSSSTVDEAFEGKNPILFAAQLPEVLKQNLARVQRLGFVKVGHSDENQRSENESKPAITFVSQNMKIGIRTFGFPYRFSVV